ncbi:TonB-dependent receptor [Prevotella sp. E13-17]|uniref:SusC/RagA family TonB-linked outer membrane protein n=1 Tax=Prevotella sp. E13-17 TaxID=2913616 RepID=UPI001EDBD797|nr:TonB-dependent receptor [Prevotella sp. E13-17]UKK51666.1 TonB-dependent receptor [Prevotella sp. E13-17]
MKKYIALLLISLCTSMSALAQKDIEVSGHVVDGDGEPLIGANVVVKDVKGLGVITDIDGFYKIKVKEYQTLVFSYIGFGTKEVMVKGDTKTINVKMVEERINAVDEVVVTGMGTQKKLTVTGAVTNVNMDDLKHFSSSNLSNTLAGNVPGIIAMQTSGQPGRNTSEFWIRGISTFGAGAKAYILVDGFERDNINDLNIEDIESFSVLKDASATAIYGSKGANGVILITTKHGKAGKIQVNGKVETSYNTRTKTPEFVDGITYANLVNEARLTRNQPRYYQPEEIDIIRTGIDPDLYPNVDWMDLLLKDGAWSNRANVNLSGGGNTSRYYASVSFVNDEGMYKTDKTLKDKYDTNANYKRWNYRLNVDIDITPTTLLKLGISGDLSKRNSPGMLRTRSKEDIEDSQNQMDVWVNDDDIWGQLFGYNPLLSPIVYSNGYMPMINIGRGNSAMINPWVSATQSGYNENWSNNLQSNVTLEQDLKFITPGLKFTGRFGFDTYNSNWISHQQAPALYSAFPRNTQTGEITYDRVFDQSDMKQSSGSDGSRREFIDLLLHWDRKFAKVHNVGANLKYTQDSYIQTQNIGDDIKNSIAKKNMALAGQVTYNYNNRYFADFNFGYNGSENFADNHRFGFFPAWSLAWNIGEEKLVQETCPWINMLKIRFSHGKVGNDNLGNERFPYLYTLGNTDAGWNWGNGHVNGIHYTQVASPNVTWEVAKKNDLGLDIVVWNNRFSLTVDYFHEKRTGIYMARNYLPWSTGLESSPRANVGAVKSEGFDGNFKYEETFGEVRLTARGNITYSKNTILDHDVENNVYPYQYTRGYRVDQVRGLIAEGLFKDYDDIRNSPRQDFGQVQPGDIKYKDVNGDGVINDGDVVAIGATRTPNLIYGLGLSVMYKNFDINLHFQGAGKSTFLINGMCVYAFSNNNYGQIFKGMLDNRYVDAQTAAQLGIPANEDPNADYPRLTYGNNNNNNRASSFWLRDGRYLRLKNVDLGYTLPKTLVNKAHLNQVRFFLQATNLLTFSKFKTWDPEMASSTGQNYPITKAVTLGVQVNL